VHHATHVSYAIGDVPDSTGDALTAVREAVCQRDSILVSGRPGAGKTTGLKALLREAAISRPHDQLVLIEDRPEVQPSYADAVSLLARRAGGTGRSALNLTASPTPWPTPCARTSTRSCGELRTGDSAQGLLLVTNTGLRAIMATIHTDSAVDTLQRVEDLVRLAGAPAIRRTIARFVQLVVHLDMAPDRSQRYVSEVVRVLGVDDRDEYRLDAADDSRATGLTAAPTTHGRASRPRVHELGDSPCA
jgi:Flp pilus assembly CpaF family ATPase